MSSNPPTGDFPDNASIIPGADRPLWIRLAAPGSDTSGANPDDSDLHQKILGRIRSRREFSARKMGERHDTWAEVDENQRMFVDLTRRAAQGDGTKDPEKLEMPFKRAIVMPVSFAIQQVRLTQMLGLYLHREPPLQVEGRAAEDMSGAKLVEAVLAYDTQQSKYASVLHSFLQDADRYGLGIIYDVWETEEGYVYPETGAMALLMRMPKLMRMLNLAPSKQWGVKREYNRWSNIDPYRFFPDPRIPISNLQEGEFCGHRFFRGASYLRSKAMDDKGQNGIYFNVEEALKRGVGAASSTRTSAADAGGRGDTMDDFTQGGTADSSDKGYNTLDHMQIKLIPKEWGLEASDRPEIYWFTIANDRIIIRAHKCPYDTGEYTYAAAEVNPDPHVIHNPGMAELLLPIQRLINWLYNSHIENAKKTLNNRMIVAPSLINMNDLLHTKGAGHIRMTAEGEALARSGADVSRFAFQLNVSDLTRGHIETAGSLLDFAQRMGASNDPAQGQPVEGDKTLGEVQSIIAASSARLAITAQLIDSAAMQALAARAVANRQQLTSQREWYRIVGDPGDVEETAGLQRLQIDRWDLQGNYDYIAHSAVLPADPVRQGQLWLQFLQIGATYPALFDPNSSPDGMVLDLRKIFNKAAIELGARNIQQFYRQVQQQIAAAPQVQVQPDAQVAAGQQAGNVVPFQQATAPPVAPLQ